jgi:hypothetical protein
LIPPPAVLEPVAPAVVPVLAAAVVVPVVAELPGLLDEPQPAVNASTQHAITAAIPVFIDCDPFSTSSCGWTIAYDAVGGRRLLPA